MRDQSLEHRREQLYRLLPQLYQVLDADKLPDDQSGPLRSLLSIVGEQVAMLEDDLARWYDNWFIETCEPWVVPYVGDLVGYESAAKELNTEEDPESPLNRSVVFPRREVADTIALRRRKGTLALLEELSRRIVGWPARAVEYRRFTAGAASLNYLRSQRSTTVDVRRSGSLVRLDAPGNPSGEPNRLPPPDPSYALNLAFDRMPRAVDVRRINSHRTRGRYNLPAIGLFVYRRKIDSATLVPAGDAIDEPAADQTCADHYLNKGKACTFDAQGYDVPLHVLPRAEESPESIAKLLNLPVPLSRRMLRRKLTEAERGQHAPFSRIVGAKEKYYGIGKSLFIVAEYGAERKLILAENVLVTSLRKWQCSFAGCKDQDVAVDPELGRIMFHPASTPNAVWTTYHFGRAAYMGGGEYERQFSAADIWKTVESDSVDPTESCTLDEAITEWKALPNKPSHTVIEIANNEEHVADFEIEIPTGKTLEIRAANYSRPCLRASRRCHFNGAKGCQLILDGLLFEGTEIYLTGEFSSVLIRHCTLTPHRARLNIRCKTADVNIEHCIVGAITARAPESTPVVSAPNAGADDCPPVVDEPISLRVADSILDSGSSTITGDGHSAWARLSAVRTTVFGAVRTHAVDLIENCIFRDLVCVENSLTGCVRFSYIPPKSCTPARFHCQPPLAVSRTKKSERSHSAAKARLEAEQKRVRPHFISMGYCHPDYARLADHTPLEILQGADDEGEMGVHHNEFFSQRAVHLKRRIQEFIPAGSDAEIIFET